MSSNSLAQIGGGLAGAALGAFFGPVGAQIGFAIGAAAGGYLVPAQLPDQEGPRLDDLNASGSGYGQPIPKVFGTFRVACDMIWTSGVIETKHEDEVGGKGGSSSQSVTSYTYSMSAAYRICEGEIIEVRRVWINKDLVFDQSDTASGTALRVSISYADNVVIYTGSETQLPSPLQESYEGAGNVPPYRGMATIEFEELQLAEFGNGMVSVEVEVVRATDVSASTPPAKLGTMEAGAFSASGHYQGVIVSPVWWPNDIVQSTTTIQWRMHDYDGNYLGNLRTMPVTVSGGSGYAHVFTCQNDVGIWCPFNSGRLDVWKNQFFQGSPANPWGAGSSQVYAWDVYYWAPATRTDGMGIVRIGMNVFTLSRSGSGEFGVSRWPIVLDEQTGVESISMRSDKMIPTFDLGVPETVTDKPNLWRDSEGYLWLGHDPVDGAGAYSAIRMNTSIEVLNHYTGAPWSQFSAFIYYWPDGRAWWAYGFKSGSPYVRIYEFDPEDNNTSWTYIGDFASGSPAAGWSLSDLGGGFFTHHSHIYTVLNTVPLGTMTLAEVVAEILESVGLTTDDYDVSALSSVDVKGFALTTTGAARRDIEPLMQAFRFDMPLVDNKLVAVLRGGASAKTIPLADLAARKDSVNQDMVTIDKKRLGELELPRRVVVKYIEQEANYITGEQHSDRRSVKGTGISTVNLPMVMNASEAAKMSEELLYLAYAERNADVRFSLSAKYLELVASDVVTVGDDLLRIRINEVNLSAPLLMEVSGTIEWAPDFTSTKVGQSNVNIATASSTAIGPTILFPLDIPIIVDSHDDTGMYLAASGFLPAWRGAIIYKSSDLGASFVEVDNILTSARQGVATNTLASGRTDTWDNENTLTIRTNLGQSLGSSTELAVCNGVNIAAFGSDGRWELIQWVTATDNGDGTWTLSQLLRGRRGTEHNIGLHAVGDMFIALNSSALLRYQLALDVPTLHKASSLGTDPAEAMSQLVENTGEGKRPFSVCHVQGTRDGSDNLTLTWERRSRLSYPTNYDLPLGEDDQSYEIEFWDTGDTAQYGTTKTYNPADTLDDPTYTYTAAQQTTDTATPGQTFLVKIYQMSGQVGRGTEWSGEI